MKIYSFTMPLSQTSGEDNRSIEKINPLLKSGDHFSKDKVAENFKPTGVCKELFEVFPYPVQRILCSFCLSEYSPYLNKYRQIPQQNRSPTVV
ncbi:hypothetical protein BGX34_009654 [Mortierella sp. NVP85]|nr:hypothetical protein BGX34_009654 [Mortierella sp. NVP85]